MRPPPTWTRLLAGVTLVAALAVGLSKGPVAAATRQFRGVNWADARDNFVPDALVLGGLDPADTPEVTRLKAHAILLGFEKTLGANTVRLPVNYPTVSGPGWAAYASVVDEASRLGQNVVLSYWEANKSGHGMVDNLPEFWALWQTIVDRFGHDRHVYFEPMNEPHGYKAADWLNLAAEWVRRYPSVPKGRVIVSGVGYNQQGTPIGADPRFDGCLISIHIYGFWETKATTEAAWQATLDSSVGAYAARTLISEFGAPMTTGLDYNGPIVEGPAAHFLAFMKGVSSRARALGLGTIYWPGLRVGDTYSLETVSGSGTQLSLTVTNPSGRDRLRASWGK